MCNTQSEKSDKSDSDMPELVDEESEEEENICIRAKWTIDGASTIDEAIEKLNDFIEQLKHLKTEGWDLREPINDDYGFLYKTAE
jgi:hypothetical protein